MFSRLANIILCVLIPLAMTSQDFNKKDFSVYRTKEGLSNNNIFSLAQDAYGYIWVGTEKGLNRFDGLTFQQFYSDSSSKSLPEDLAFGLRWINKDEMAVLTNSGLHIINTRTLERYNLVIPADSAQDPLIVNSIMDIAADNKENIYIITNTGFYHFHEKKLEFRYDHPPTKNAKARNIQFAWGLARMNDNDLLITAKEGFYVYNIREKNLHQLNNNDDPFFHQIANSYEAASFIYKDERFLGIMPFVRKKEFVFFDIQKKIKQTVTIPQNIRERLFSTPAVSRFNDSIMGIGFPETGLAVMRYHQQTNTWAIDSTVYFENDFCTALLMDKDKRLWIGSINGLYKHNRFGGRIEQVTLPGESFKIQKMITAFAVASSKLFTATALEGLFVYKRDSLSLLKQLMTPEKDFSLLTQLVKINEDSLLCARAASMINTVSLDYKKIYFKNIPNPAKVTESVFKDSRGNIYVTKLHTDTVYVKVAGDTSFSVVRFTGLQKIKTTYRMAEDPEGNIWFAGLGGLIRFNKQSRRSDLFLDSFPAIRSGTKHVTSNLVFDNKGKIYFGISNNGLIIYDSKENKFSQVTRAQGLPDNTIVSLYLHRNQTLWLATENGIANYDPQTGRVLSFGVADGMPIDPSSCNILYYDSAHGHLYAGFSQTIVRFDPDKMKKNQKSPDFFVESITITGRRSIYHPEEEIRVPYKYNSMIIDLTAINYEDAPQQLFAYRILKTGDEPWQEIGSQSSIIFSNLSPGKHRLQVKVYIRNNSWPEQIKELTIIISPPFWKTIWFYALVALAIAAIAYYLHRRRIKTVIQKADIDKQLAQTEMKALHAQMNPHFIFNCLNSIREMILNNENEQASLYLSKFARLIRITLNQSSKPFVSLTDTVDYLERYIEMEKIRSSHFVSSIEVDKDLSPDDVMVPPMLIQPFIENAIWHGTSQKKNMNIHISFNKKENELICIIDDNGMGIEESLKRKENQAQEPSVGIANIKQRIELLNEKYNLQSAIKIEDKSVLVPANGTGTIVTLHLPIKTNESLWNS